MNWIIISVIGAVISAVVAAGVAVVAWLLSRVIAGVDEKIEGLEDKIVLNTTKLYEKGDERGNRITRLEAIEEIRNKQ